MISVQDQVLYNVALMGLSRPRNLTYFKLFNHFEKLFGYEMTIV